MIRGINHITLTVNDLGKSLAFYSDVLGLKPQVRWKNGAYLLAGEQWFCLLRGDSAAASDGSHLAFDVAADEFASLCDRLRTAGVREWRENRSEGASYYFLDPDGHRLEVHVGSLQSRLAALRESPYDELQWY